MSFQSVILLLVIYLQKRNLYIEKLTMQRWPGRITDDVVRTPTIFEKFHSGGLEMNSTAEYLTNMCEALGSTPNIRKKPLWNKLFKST